MTFLRAPKCQKHNTWSSVALKHRFSVYSEDSVMIMSNNSLTFTNGYSESKAETPHVKKRHRRLKSANVKNQDNDGKYEDSSIHNRRRRAIREEIKTILFVSQITTVSSS